MMIVLKLKVKNKGIIICHQSMIFSQYEIFYCVQNISGKRTIHSVNIHLFLLTFHLFVAILPVCYYYNEVCGNHNDIHLSPNF